MKTFWILLLFFVFNIHNCFAKCPIESFQVFGKVLNPDNLPIDGANVSVFVDDKMKGFYSRTKGNGEYTAFVLYDTYSGISWGGDQCNHIPSLITIVVMIDGYWSVMIKNDFKNISALDRDVYAQPIVLEERKSM